MVKIAGVQFDIQFNDLDTNLKRICNYVQKTQAAESAHLTIFPECALTGYCFESLAEAWPASQPIPGPATEAVSRACAESGGFAIFGMLERAGDAIFNATALVGPNGVVGSYRKLHLPYLGVDRFLTHGDRPLAIHAAGPMHVGMNICYDGSFPEAARTLMLLGADLIALPTNWPPGAKCFAECTIRTRAVENGIYYAAVNRVGTERGVQFIGQSQVADPGGRLLACASSDQEEILYAECDLQRARQKHIVRIRGEHELHRLADRRPEMYDTLVDRRSSNPCLLRDHRDMDDFQIDTGKLD